MTPFSPHLGAESNGGRRVAPYPRSGSRRF
jgi:hypothetical protein